MKTPSEPLGPHGLDDLLAAWGARPPATAAPEARRRIVARLPERHRRSQWWGLAAAATLLVALITAVVTTSPGVRRPAPGATVTTQVADANVVVWLLDDGTPLYLFLDPADGREKRTPS